MPLYGGIEAGGTKFVCAVGTGPDDLRAVERFPTTTPDETIARCIAWFRAQPEPVAALGIGSFGPVDPDPASPTFGHITSTPKPGWRDTDLRGRLQAALTIPVAFDTDVNAAALGEQRWGAAQDVHTFVYLTVGTGIGGGVMVNGGLLHGLVHPELGHIRVARDPAQDPFPGCCPFHGDCLEGLAAGPAIERRWGARAESLPPGHPAWALEAHYLGVALATFICTLSPQKIILGGGVAQQAHLFPLIREQTAAQLNGYVQAPPIVPPGLGDRAGVLGAIALAATADRP